MYANQEYLTTPLNKIGFIDVSGIFLGGFRRVLGDISGSFLSRFWGHAWDVFGGTLKGFQMVSGNVVRD